MRKIIVLSFITLDGVMQAPIPIATWMFRRQQMK